MTSDEVLIELLERVGAHHGATVLINGVELSHWPKDLVAAMKSQGLLGKTRPAKSAVCPGCEQECTMSVHTLTNGARGTQAFIVCDKRNDINRVPVPIGSVNQWQVSGDSIADLLSGLLDLQRPRDAGIDATRWEIGLFKGAKHATHVVLVADSSMALSLAGHSVPLLEVLTFDGKAFIVDKRKLSRLVDQPVAGGGDVESAAQRRERLKKRVQHLKSKGVKAFLKTVADEEGISISRLKQLLQEENEPKKPKPLW